MIENLKKELNKTETLNGDLAFKSTNSDLLDFFSSAGAMRNSSKEDILNRFVKAYNENKSMTLKALFYMRDIRGGQGERRLFNICMSYLLANFPNESKYLLGYVSNYGRWDDIINLFGINDSVDSHIIHIISHQLDCDKVSDKPSLLAKWLKSENTSSIKSRQLAKTIRKGLKLSSKDYRKLLSNLRAKIKLIEHNLTTKNYETIEYDKLPSKASMKYRKAFLRNDETNYTKFLEQVQSGEKKINASTIYPYEIYDKVKNSSINDVTLDELWKALPNYVDKEENALVMADVSGSMQGRPMSVSVSLAIYFAERNKGRFANHYLTFSSHPVLVEIKGNNIYEKIHFVERTNVGYDTNFELAFDTLLNVAVKDNLSQSDMPKRIYAISDMQFNSNSNISGIGKSSFQRIKEKYNKAGYEVPELVFWNVNDYGNKPVTMDEKGVQLVSGFSPVLFKQVVSGLSAYDLMIQILSSDRYKDIN